MRYLGGKSRTAQQIGGYLNHIRQPGQVYWEPFVGAGWILERVRGGERYASDANAALIAMWQALQAGWQPPQVVTERMHKKAKSGGYEDQALTAFIRFGCSFGGDWNGGYANDKGKGKTLTKSGEICSANSLKRKIKGIATAQFFPADFLECPVPARRCLIYCDPPYANTTAYGAVPPFDSGQFWSRVRYLTEQGHTVIVSEYQAPLDFSCVMEMPTKTELHTVDGREARVERLFRYGDHQPLQLSLFEAANAP